MNRILAHAGAHWYVPLFLCMLAAVGLLARDSAFMASGGEAALLTDLCITAPLLYALCYGRRQPVRKTLIRALAIACAGVWLAGWLIPAAEQSLLVQLAPLRWAGLMVVAVFEVRLLVLALRLAFSESGTAKEIAERSDAPEWLARFMLLEARFWHAVWQLLRGGRK